ncbi:MAG: hypothetical protein ACREJC_12965 [Tepidisphaeraceae bacterium]
MAPYFVQMRALERRLLRSALAQAVETLGTVTVDDTDKVRIAATMLGVKPGYLKVRAKVLGGVLDDAPLEPPTATATEVWATEHNKASMPERGEEPDA